MFVHAKLLNDICIMKRILLAFLYFYSIGNLYCWAQDEAPEDNPAHTATEVDEANPPLRLGYCNTAFNPYYTRYFYEQNDQPHEFGAAIYLPASYLSKYKGAKISSIHFALYEEVGEHYTVFVSRDLSSSTQALQPISYTTVKKGDFHAGWNAANISPVTITGNEGLYVGWVSAVNKEEAMHGNFTLDHTVGQHNYEDNFIMDSQGRWFNVQKSVGRNLMIRAYAESDNPLSIDAGISHLDGADVIWQNRATAYNAVITNYGVDTIHELEVDILSDGKHFDTKYLKNLDLAHNERSPIYITGVKYPEEGNHTLSVNVVSVNDCDDADPSDNMASIELYAIPRDATECKRNVLFEEMTSELDPEAPHADFVFRAAIEGTEDLAPQENVIWVKHHVDGKGKRKDGNPWDTYAQDEDREYIRLYEGYPAANCDFTPGVTVDRNIINGMQEKTGVVYFVESEVSLNTLFRMCEEIPCYIDVVPTLQYNADSRQLDIDVDAKAQISEMIHQTDLHLTVYVVEDSLRSVLQKTNASTAEYLNSDGTFTQNGVIRAYPAGVWGEHVDIEDFAFHRHYTTTLAPEWNPANIRVVAFVHNYDENAQTGNNAVYNAGQAFVKHTDGISQTTMVQTSHPTLITDLQGRRTSTISQGVYIMDGKKVVY